MDAVRQIRHDHASRHFISGHGRPVAVVVAAGKPSPGKALDWLMKFSAEEKRLPYLAAWTTSGFAFGPPGLSRGRIAERIGPRPRRLGQINGRPFSAHFLVPSLPFTAMHNAPYRYVSYIAAGKTESTTRPVVLQQRNDTNLATPLRVRQITQAVGQNAALQPYNVPFL